MVTPAQRRVSISSARRLRRLVVEPLEDRALLAPFTVGGDPSVNPADFRITTFVSGLNYPGGMLTLSDGSLLVGVSNPVSGTSYFNSTGELLRFTDTDGNGVADNAAGEVLYNGLPGDLTALSQAGEFILATSSEVGSERISVLRAGATPATPLTLVGSIDFGFASGWWHTTYASAVRPAPGLPGEYDVFFNIGSENNGVARDGNGNVILDGNGNPTYQLTTDPVTASGLIGGTLLGDSIYMVTLQDNNGTPILSNLTRVASGLRNAASMAVDSAGDLFFADNGIDGNDNGEYGWSTDELDEIPAAQIGGPTEFFGFPEMINGQLDVSYAKTNPAPGQAVTVVNPGVGVQPLIPFEPLPDSNLAPLGSRSQGASGFALSPPDFPAGLNDGVFVGFHGEYDSGGIANGKNPLVYADPGTGHYFDFVSNDEAGVGHFDGAVSTSNSLFLSDISPGGSMDSGAGQGAIYQIEAIPSPTPTPTPTPTPPPNQPPVLTPIADQTVDEGVELTVPVTASDPDGDTITYGLGSGAPPGAAIDPTTGLFTWTPDPYSSTGTYSITVVATDSGSPPLSDAASFTVDVLAVNHPPNLIQIAPQLAEQGQPTEVRVARYASDLDQPPQTLTYSLAPGAPSGAILDPASGLFAWTVPPNQPIGGYPIGVTVTDDGSPPMSASETFTINVVPFNHPPVLAPIPEQMIDEGSLLTVAVAATDPDAGQTIAYSLGAGAPTGSAIDPRTGVFTWTPDPYAGWGMYSIIVVATDDGPIPKTDSEAFTVDVVAVNHPPVFTAAIPAQVAAPGRTLQFSVAGFASDPDQPPQTLTYSLAPGAPAGASLDPASGQFTWSLPPDQHIGDYSFGVVVTDSGSPPLSQTTNFVVDVVDVGPAATVARARVGRRHGLTITLRFSQPLDTSAAGDLDDYILVPAKQKTKKAPASASIPLTATYNAATGTVTLVAGAKVKRGQVLRLTVVGTGPDGLAKVTGLSLAGDRVHVGTNYVAAITGGTIKQTNAARSRVRVASSEARRRTVVAPHVVPLASTVHPSGPLAPEHRTTRRK
jgi:Putative Ig domain